MRLIVFASVILLNACSSITGEYDGRNAAMVDHDCDRIQRDLTSSWHHNKTYWCGGRNRANAAHPDNDLWGEGT